MFTQQVHLQMHIQSKHEGIKYPCSQCDYQATGILVPAMLEIRFLINPKIVIISE